MADLWEQILQTCKLDEIELPVLSIERSGGWAFARQKVPFRPGQETENTGREPWSWALQIPLFNGLVRENGKDLYPARFEQLMFLLNDETKLGEFEFVDPFLGPFAVKVASFRTSETAGERGGAMVSLTLEERTAEAATLRLALSDLGGNSFSRATELGETVDAGLDDLGVDDATIDQAFTDSGFPLEGEERAWPSGEKFSSAVASGFETINQATSSLDDVTSEVSKFTARVDSVLSLSVVEDLGAWELRASLVRLRQTFAAAGERIITSDSRRVTVFRTSGVTNIWTIAQQLYGDSRAADALLRLNAIPNPSFIADGTELRVWVPS